MLNIIGLFMVGMCVGFSLVWLFVTGIESWKRFDAATERLINELDGNNINEWKTLEAMNEQMLKQRLS